MKMSDETLDSGNANGGTPAQPNAGGSQGQSDSNGSSASQSQSLEKCFRASKNWTSVPVPLQGEKQGREPEQAGSGRTENEDCRNRKLTKRGMTQDEAIEALSERGNLEAARILRSQQSDKARTSPVGNRAGRRQTRQRCWLSTG